VPATSQRVVLQTATMPWVASPVAGVERRMLDRVGAEVARATSIVRYAPDSRFSAHMDGGGEEFLVLEGVFSEEHGGITTVLERWAAGTRVPAHTHPGGEEILVLEGSLHDDDGGYPALSWLRNPRGSRHAPWAGPEGALIYQKSGHIGARWLALPGADQDGG
jgi:anti-sigma factor ChrR (cupin superfamily)